MGSSSNGKEAGVDIFRGSPYEHDQTTQQNMRTTVVGTSVITPLKVVNTVAPVIIPSIPAWVDQERIHSKTEDKHIQLDLR